MQKLTLTVAAVLGIMLMAPLMAYAQGPISSPMTGSACIFDDDHDERALFRMECEEVGIINSCNGSFIRPCNDQKENCRPDFCPPEKRLTFWSCFGVKCGE